VPAVSLRSTWMHQAESPRLRRDMTRPYGRISWRISARRRIFFFPRCSTSRNANLSGLDLTRLFNTAHIRKDDDEGYDAHVFVAELRCLEIKLHIAQD
jgi:hypothetical protein